MKDTRNIFFALLLGALIAHPLQAAEPKRPNILFILVDDLGWADVGYNGATYHATPNIDRLAEKSLVFNRAYARPTCSPSRASLFTGLNAPHTGIYHVAGYYRVKTGFKVAPVKSGHFYDRPITMLADALKSAGYSTGYVGKWHVTKNPTKHGFDFNAGGWERGDPPSYFSPYKNPALKNGPEGEYLPDRLAEESIGFIRRNRDNPFFLSYAPYSVHYPIQAREEDIHYFEGRKKEDDRQLPAYAAMVYAVDRAIQRVLDALEEEGLADNTLVVFTSDNGVNGRAGLSGPLRGSKGSVYEGGTRVPTMVCWPGRTTAGTTDALIDIVDWYPTLIDAASVATPKHQLDGMSLVPLLKGEVDKVRDTLHMHVPVYNSSEGKDDVMNQFHQTPATVAMQGKYKYVRNYEPDRADELFDLDADIGESKNVIGQHPEIAREMGRAMDRWLKANKAELPSDDLSSINTKAKSKRGGSNRATNRKKKQTRSGQPLSRSQRSKE
jgi:arylsulfatase A-like enzyme